MPDNKKLLLTGWVLSGLVALFLLMDSVTHIMNIAPVVNAMTQLGFPTTTAPKIGVLELVLLVLYVVPRTATLGAILWMGVLGGAIASHVRVATRCSRTSCSACMSASSCGLGYSCANRSCAP